MSAALVQQALRADPFAAYATAKLPDRLLMILVGVVIILLSLRSLLQVLSPLERNHAVTARGWAAWLRISSSPGRARPGGQLIQG